MDAVPTGNGSVGFRLIMRVGREKDQVSFSLPHLMEIVFCMEKIDGKLLKRFFEGKCNKTEREEVIQWFTEEKYSGSLKFAWAEHFNEILDREELESDQARLLSLSDRINHQIDIRASKRAVRFLPGRAIRFAGKVAAILFLPLLLISGWYYMKYPPTLNHVGIAAMVAPRGARIHFTLPDGSQGWLNSESTLKYPLAFTGKKRVVELSGEGYFEVFKNARKPFIVKTGKIEVKALGTKFDVSTYPDEEAVEVTLETGKVVVLGTKPGQKETRLAVMDTGEQVHIRKVDHRIQKKMVEDPGCYIAWKDGKLIFRNDPMGQVIRKLGRWYNVKFYLQEKKLEDYRYHATFQYESLDEVLKLIKLTSPVDYKIIKRKKLPDGSFSKKRIILFAKKGINLNNKYVQ